MRSRQKASGRQLHSHMLKSPRNQYIRLIHDGDCGDYQCSAALHSFLGTCSGQHAWLVARLKPRPPT
eukprot:360822-Chlamydomonas_euryale.AAC.3